MINFRKSLGAITMLLSMLSLSAQGLTVQKVKDKYGYADEKGDMIIKAQYEHAYPFQDGRAKVCKGGKWGFIDPKGKAVIPVQYDNIGEFENGIARVTKGKKYGFIKEDGTIFIKPDFDFIGSFNDAGFIWVGKGKNLKESLKGLYRHDKEIIPPRYKALGFYVPTDSTDYTAGAPIPTKDGMPVNNEITTNFCRLSVSEIPYVWTCNILTQTAVFDTIGQKIIKNQTGALGMPHDGYALLRAYSKKGDKQYYTFNYISTDGKSTKLFKKEIKQLVDEENIFDGCHPFNNAIAMCGNENTAYLIDTNGNNVSSIYDHLELVPGKGYISTANNLYGLVTLQGKELVIPSYGKLLAPFGESDILPAQNAQTGQFGFINFAGEETVPFTFDDAIAFTDGKAYVKKDNHYGIVDQSGNFIVQNRWEAILPPVNPGCDYVWVKSPETQLWHTLQISKDTLSFDKGYADALSYDGKGRAFIKEGEMIGAVTTDGAAVLPLNFNELSTARAAISYLDAEGKDVMEEIDAYRFNIYNSGARHKYKLHQPIDSNMWDF